MKTLVTLALILLSAVPALYSQQNPSWKALLDTARSFQIRGGNDSALHYGLRALEALKQRTRTEADTQDTTYAQALNLVGYSWLYFNPNKAEPYCKEAYALCKKIFKEF